MNILYIIGNGFDINFGLKTDYQNFYDTYLAEKSESEFVKKLKLYLREKRYEVWADLELGLGDYTQNVESVEEIEQICHDISRSLRRYLSGIQKSFMIQASDILQMKRYLVSPQSGLLEGNVRALNKYVNEGREKVINAISFNYTNTFEALCGYRNEPISIDGNSVVGSVRHIHLSLNNMDVILGVNDESQIANKKFAIPEVFDLLVKPHINNQLGTLVDEECRTLIRNASLICLFGVSLGDTDKCWWQEIGKSMAISEQRLIYYAYDSDNIQYNNQLIGKKRSYLNKLLKKCDLASDESITSRIYVGYKTDFFKIR